MKGYPSLASSLIQALKAVHFPSVVDGASSALCALLQVEQSTSAHGAGSDRRRFVEAVGSRE